MSKVIPIDRNVLRVPLTKTCELCGSVMVRDVRRDCDGVLSYFYDCFNCDSGYCAGAVTDRKSNGNST